MIVPITQLCECPGAGHCKRYDRTVSHRDIAFCRADCPAGVEARELLSKGEEIPGGEKRATLEERRENRPPKWKTQDHGEETDLYDELTLSDVGIQLHAVILRETGIEIPCPACVEQIANLNLLKVVDATKEKTSVVGSIRDRAWANAGWQDRFKLAADTILKTATVGILSPAEDIIGGWFDKAISKSTDTPPAKKKQRSQPKNRGSVVAINKLKRPANHTRQRIWSGAPVARVALPDDVRKNLIYHIYPVKKERWLWQWNLDQILKRIDLFNGRKVMGIVYDGKSDPPEAVKEYVKGHGFEFIVEKNVKELGENVTAVKLMSAVHSFEHEVTFRAHAKGVSKSFYMKNGKYHKGKQGLEFKSGEAVQDWTKIMYETCLDYWDVVRGGFESHAMVGPFKRHANMNRADWYYSGSFYWYKHTEFYQRDWRDLDDKRYGVESIPGTLFDSAETYCVFGEDPPSIYARKNMDNVILPKYEEWKNHNVPNRILVPGKLTTPTRFAALNGTLAEMSKHAETKPSDINEHVHSLRCLAERCDHVTEFGVRCGVSTVALLAGEPKILRSYDIKEPPNISTLRSIVPPETDWKFAVRNTLKLKIEPTDLLFIDTLHEYGQLRDELKRHGNKSRKYLAFHDTVTFGERGELGGGGLNRAIREFQQANPHWAMMADFKNCNGLRVLRREN